MPQFLPLKMKVLIEPPFSYYWVFNYIMHVKCLGWSLAYDTNSVSVTLLLLAEIHSNVATSLSLIPQLIYFPVSLLQISRRKKNVKLTIMRNIWLVSHYLPGKDSYFKIPLTHTSTTRLPSNMAVGVGGWGAGSELTWPCGTLDSESTQYLTDHWWSLLQEGWPGLFLGPCISFLLLPYQVITNSDLK